MKTDYNSLEKAKICNNEMKARTTEVQNVGYISTNY